VSTAARPAGSPRPRPGAPAGAARGTHRAALQVVSADPGGARASSGAFAVFVGAVLGLGLLGLLLLNTLLAQGAFTTSDLKHKQSALDITAQSLEQQVAVLQSPQVLASSALQLGMVVTRNPVFLDPRTGRIWGVPQAGAYPRPVVTAPPSPPAVTGVTSTVPGQTSTTTTATTAATAKPTTKPSGTPKPTATPSGPPRTAASPKPTTPPKPGSH